MARTMTDDGQEMSPDSVYVLRDDVAVESFDDGGLVLQALDRRIVEVNETACRILHLLDGNRTLRDIAEALSTQHKRQSEETRTDVTEVMAHLRACRVVKPVCKTKPTTGGKEMSEETRYLANPDVSCRVEDDDGAILYNADNDAVQIINPIGLEIWQTLSSPHTRNELVDHLKQVCEGAPEDDIGKDVNEFLDRLLNRGFIGSAGAGQ